MGFFRKMWGKAKEAVQRMKSKFDKEGSYTGSLESPKESKRPEQDADDL